MLEKNCFVQCAHTHGCACSCMHGDAAACRSLVMWEDIGLSEMLPRDPDATCSVILCFGTENLQLCGQDILILHISELPCMRCPQ